MARAQLASESEGESDGVKHPSKTNRNTATGEESNNEEEAQEGNGEEDDEPEYEIEQILDAKNGVFPQVCLFDSGLARLSSFNATSMIPGKDGVLG